MTEVRTDQAFLQLRRDYETLVLSGVKFTAGSDGGPTLDPTQMEALERLVGAGLAAREDRTFVLRGPRDAHFDVDNATAQFLETLYALWLKLDDDSRAGDEILYGELGYWQHWGNTLNNGTDRTVTPLRMDLVLPEQGSFLTRNWTGAIDPAIVDYVFSNGLVNIRAIVPPETRGAAVQSVVEMGIEFGVQVRVMPSTVEFSIYDGETVVLPDEQPAGEPERHRLTRRRAVVDPLVNLFEVRWASALPWESFIHGSAGILQLLALGWTDTRIAQAVGASPRTISRRIAALMKAADVQSRFALGMKYALHEL